MQAPEHLIERIKEAALQSESKPFPGMDRVWNKIEERLDDDTFYTSETPFPGMDKVWGKIEERLDETAEPQRKVIPFRKYSIAAAVLLLLSLGTFYFLKNSTTDTVQTTIYASEDNSDSRSEGMNLTADAQSAGNPIISPAEVQQEKNLTSTNNVKKRRMPGIHTAPPAIAYTQPQVHPDAEQGSYFTRKIKGHVTDENGESLAGAIVQAKETKTVAITDIDGNYEIAVSGNLTELEVSGAGMVAKTITINPSGNVPATALESDPGVLADVLVYSKNNRKSYVAPIAGQEAVTISKRPLTDIDKAIAGELPGVKIRKYGGALTVSTDLIPDALSGAGFTGRPLVVIDGTLYNGNSLALKPGEVESLTILKDETATAVYGSKGSNGAILIKTKTGKGYAEPKPGIFKKMKNIFKKEK